MEISVYSSGSLPRYILLIKDGKALKYVKEADTKKKTCLIARNYMPSTLKSYDRAVVPSDYFALNPAKIAKLEKAGIEVIDPEEYHLLQQTSIK